MSNRLTAEEARKIAMDWRHNTCAKHVDELLEKIKQAAQRGELELRAKDPDDIPFVVFKSAMTELGYRYTIHGCAAGWSIWHWDLLTKK